MTTSSGGAVDPFDGFVRQVPDGDSVERLVCAGCGFIHYENPKVVVGAVVTWEDRILLCRRAIHPRRDFWTLPAGYMEMNETSAEGA
ncbi:MAG: NUDIX hydrolase, partial [Alphaproteobacteria bacterium]|nr:NUDIX hydrolase [Alphaproteobacteria bacterium]